jgi:hypothetical protein
LISDIQNSLQTPANKVAMELDDFDKDIKPAVAAGVRAF